MSDVSGSWHPDPFGRFAQRYHDGTQWTEHVVDANGAQTTDPPVATAEPPTVSGPTPPTAGYGPPPMSYGPPPSAATTAGGGGLAISPGLIIAAAGLLLVILSVFSLNWMKVFGEEGTLSDVRDANKELEANDYEYGVVPKLYIDWGYIVGIAAAALAAVSALNKNLSDRLKVAGVLAAAVFLGLHLYAAFNARSQLDSYTGDASIAIGVWVGAVGYAAALVGAFLGPKSTT